MHVKVHFESYSPTLSRTCITKYMHYGFIHVYNSSPIMVVPPRGARYTLTVAIIMLFYLCVCQFAHIWC